MSNILDYVDKYGNKTFENKPFNELDGLVFSVMSYADFSGIVSMGSIYGKRLTLKSAVTAYMKKRRTRNEKLNQSFIDDIRTLLIKCSSAKRYENMKMISFLCRTDTNQKEQFGALAVEYMDKNAFVGFRGTDNTIIGWREDFAMSYINVPAQLEAVDFLSHVMSIWEGNIITGGHSKGGNLAMYSSIKTDRPERITSVYNFDAPGLSMELTHDKCFLQMRSKMYSYIPQASMVGKIFERDYDSQIIRSTLLGMKQHNPMSWQVNNSSFVFVKKVTKSSRVFEDTMKEWIDGLDYENRKEFTETVFGMMEENGFNTFDEIGDHGRFFIPKCISSFIKMNRNTRKMVCSTAMNFVKAGIRGFKRQTIKVRAKRN